MLPKDSVGAEIGVWKGDFSAEILRAAQPRELYLIDPWVIQDDPVHRESWYGSSERANMDNIHARVLRRFAKEREGGSVIVMREFSSKALAGFSDGFFDFVYIDGDHEYSAVRKDCFMAYEKIRFGGFVCGDDYTLGGWWKDGVVRAFHELVNERRAIIRYVRGGQIVVQKTGREDPA